jgi:NhaA family Na+:H+ antiporter
VKLETALTAILIICAFVTSAVVAKREFFPSTASSQVLTEHKPTKIAHWEDYLDQGVHIGPTRARVQLIEFADFECPFCGSFHKILKDIRVRYPNDVSLDYVHFPLPMHRFALLAARVAECAGDQGRFEEMYDTLFDGQESFGLKPWRDYATAAGVPDLVAFDGCIRLSDPIPHVERGKELGARLDVRETPTLIVNGWKLGRPPDAAELDTMVKAVLAGKSPVAAKM